MGCDSRGPDVDFTIDLGKGSQGAVEVRLRIRSPGSGSLTLSSFAQPAAMRVESLRALSGGREIPVAASQDLNGFLAWSLAPHSSGEDIIVEYAARPGAVEMAKMSGPTGFRLGHLDGSYGLFSARQVVLLPTSPRLPGRTAVRIIVPPGQEIETTWPPPDGAHAWSFEGRGALGFLLDATIAFGRFERRQSRDRGFEVLLLSSLPDSIRGDSARRALALEEYLAARLGRPSRPYRLVLVPRTPDGFSVPAMSTPGGLGMSLGPGIPTRWLTIGRAIGQAYLAGRIAALPESDPERRILEALPAYLTVRFSELDGWRSRREWYEQFYTETVDLDLGDSAGGIEATRLEWRTAVALANLSQELERQGRGALEDIIAEAHRRSGEWDWGRFVEEDLSQDARTKLERWLGPGPFAFPLPGRAADPPLRLGLPPARPPAGGRFRRFDFFLGARNLGLLEQCGCKKEQFGGMARRATVLRRRLGRGNPGLALEIGDALPWDYNSPALDAQKTAESDLVLSLMAHSGVRAAVAGHAEVSYGPRFLADRIARLPPGLTMLSANVAGPGLALSPRLDVTGVHPRVTLVGVMDPAGYDLGRALEFEDALADISVADPAASVAAVLHSAAGPGLTVAAGPLGPRAVMEIHEANPDLSLLVTSNYFRFVRQPWIEFERPISLATFGMLGRTLVVLLKSDAKGLVRLGLSLDRDGRIAGAELEGIPLDDAIPDDPYVRRRLDEHYAQLSAVSGMPDRSPIGDLLRRKLLADYVGFERCATCHPDEARQWSGTAHSTAFATLLEKRRHGVPGCFACHVTGYRQATGYRSMTDARLRHVQCESCHGPGSRHVERPGADSIVRIPPAAVCQECHAREHSDMDDANFGDYWARIVHASGKTGEAATEALH